jgi:hypothetical protein
MSVPDRQLSNLKWLLWLYFWLLIFEGALRKWFLPQLSTPILVARDPVVVLIYAMAVARGIFPKNAFTTWIIVLGVFSFFASLAGIGTLKITLYGLHANFLHLPLIFLIPKIFDYEDAKNVGKWLLVISIPMAMIAVLQFHSGPDARINAAAGGEMGGQLYAANGKYRPSGTFSFVTGMVSFLALVAAYLAWHFAENKIYPKILIYASMGAIAVSLMVSGSRSAVVGVAMVVAVLIFIGIRRGLASVSYLKYAMVFFVVFLVMTRIPVFHEGLAVHEARFEEGGGIHEGLIDRFFDELVNSFDACATTPLLGLGLGLGTNAGAGMENGTRQFLLSEGEWGRVISESGAVLGIAYIALRFGMFFNILGVSLKSFRLGNSLPILLLSATGLDLLTGQFGQPTELGFVVFTSGLCLVMRDEVKHIPPQNSGLKPTGQETRKIPGRSAYAESLHGGRPGGGA